MFSPGSFEKVLPNIPDNILPSRSKLALGISSLGDENQQNIRIQLAVHRYNNPTNNSVMRSFNERSVHSPIKNAFLRASPKCKSFDLEREEAQSNMNRTVNHYQEFGVFPVVHLKKHSVITKPFKQLANSEFKIQLPELPFKRFLNHTPDVYTDVKTSTRSVLDVLQDLSRKRIHTKDDSETNKQKNRGLGGDAPLDIEAPYKPLFVPKNKVSTVLMRDSTTQTQGIPLSESVQQKKIDVVDSNEPEDSKAVLRRRLARQNNEIFASLSSSTLSYSTKRCLEKSTQDNEVSKAIEKPPKKAKYITKENKEKITINCRIDSPISLVNEKKANNYTNFSGKKRSIYTDRNKVSPNKDRLTSIFLEMKNDIQKVNIANQNHFDNDIITENSIKSEGLLSNKSLAEDKTSKSTNLEKLKDKISPSTENTLSKMASAIHSSEKADSDALSEEKSEHEILNVPPENTFGSKEIGRGENFALSPTVCTSTALKLNFCVSSSFSTLKLPAASTVSISFNQTPIFSTGISNSRRSCSGDVKATCSAVNNSEDNSENHEKNVQNNNKNSLDQNMLSRSMIGFGGKTLHESGEKQDHSETFKFGAMPEKIPENSSLLVNKMSAEVVASEKDPTPVKDSKIQSLSIDFGGTGNSAIGGSVGFPSSIENIEANPLLTTSSALATTTTTTTTFSSCQQNTFGYSPSAVSDSSTNEEQAKPPSFLFNFIQTSTTTSNQPFFFTNNGTPVSAVEETKTEEVREKIEPGKSSMNPACTSSSTAFQSSSFSLSAASGTSSFGQSIFKFGEKIEASKSSQNSGLNADLFDSKSKSGIFTFGSKSQKEPTISCSQPVSSQSSMFSSNVFSFSQKSTAPVSFSGVAETTPFVQSPTSQSNLFNQNASSQPNTTASLVINTSSPLGGVSSFGQSSFGTSSSFSNPTNVFGPVSASQSTPLFGGISSTQTSLFPQTFGDSKNSFEQGSGFLQSSSQAAEFGQGSAFGAGTFGQRQANENDLFGRKNGFTPGENVQVPFGQSSVAPTFGSHSPFTFGGPSTSATTSCFTLNTPNTTSSVFTFGSAAKSMASQTSTFEFNAAPQSSSQSLFSFNSQPTTAFQFGSSAAKETPIFGSSSSTRGFSFETKPSPATSETAKPPAPVFTFGGSQPQSSNASFNFGASPSTPVFSFGGSGSSTNTPSKFCFSASQPSGGIFTPGAAASTPVLQGTFSIGSGSTQPRSRSSATRPRRRP